MITSESRNSAENITKDYYDSPDADNFYFQIWGGEDIHIGLYEPGDTVKTASARTVQKMISMISPVPESRILDAGAGYGGSARVLASQCGAHVSCLNISSRQNERNRLRNRELNLDHLIEVTDGSFESLPYSDASFDIVWSQDAILHSGNKEKVLSEFSRVLKPGGRVIFTDPMQSENADPVKLEPVLKRIHLDSMGSFAFYDKAAAAAGLEKTSHADLSHNLPVHYHTVYQELSARKSTLLKIISEEYTENMLRGLMHWVEAGRSGELAWGILNYVKK